MRQLRRAELSSQLRWQMAYGDTPEVRLNDNGELAGLVDWSETRWAPVQFDVAIWARDMVGV